MLLDFSKRRSLSFDFINLDGKQCNYTGVISAEFNEVVGQSSEKIQEEIYKNVEFDIQNKGIKDVNVNFSKLADDQKEIIIKAFLKDKYDDFIKDVKGIEMTVKNCLFEVISAEVEELEKIMEIEDDSEKK